MKRKTTLCLLVAGCVSLVLWSCVDVPSGGDAPKDYHSLVRFFNGLGVTEVYPTLTRIDTVMIGTAPFTQGTFTAGLDGSQDGVTTPATGTGQFTLNSTGDTLLYTITVKNLSDTIIGAHFHRGEAGISGPVIHPIMGSAPVTDTTVSGEWTGPTLTSEIGNLQAGRLYVNFHTLNHPLGEIRGQLYPPPDTFQTRTSNYRRRTIDFLSPDADVTLLVDNAPYPVPPFLSATGYRDIPSGGRIIDLQAVGTVDTLKVIDSTLIRQGTETVLSTRNVTITTAFLDNNPFEIRLPIASQSRGTVYLHPLISGGSHSSYMHERRVFDPTGRPDSALIRLINSSSTEITLSLSADSATGSTVASASFFGASNYMPVSVGSHTLVLVDAAATSYGSVTMSLAANRRYTIVAVDSASTVTFRELNDE